MAFSCNFEGSNCKKIIKILNLISALSIVVCGVLRLIFLSSYVGGGKFLYVVLSAYLV